VFGLAFGLSAKEFGLVMHVALVILALIIEQQDATIDSRMWHAAYVLTRT